ncbi:MAG: aminoacyl-tRNA hydrolase [bacterium]|nr:aminoacyl-tRNA hydrolase [bacterium]
MKLIVGLGNPGKNYDKTYHNVGFIILDNYIANVQWNIKDNYAYNILTIENEKVMFLKPLTYMNLSGLAVSKVVNFYKIQPKNILVIHDDINLLFGNYKFKYNSSSGGHNGIKSIISSLGTQEFCQLKIGINNNSNVSLKDYVLSSLSPSEIEDLKNKKYNDMINYYIKNGIDMTMNKFNSNEV